MGHQQQGAGRRNRRDRVSMDIDDSSSEQERERADSRAAGRECGEHCSECHTRAGDNRRSSARDRELQQRDCDSGVCKRDGREERRGCIQCDKHECSEHGLCECDSGVERRSSDRRSTRSERADTDRRDRRTGVGVAIRHRGSDSREQQQQQQQPTERGGQNRCVSH